MEVELLSSLALSVEPLSVGEWGWRWGSWIGRGDVGDCGSDPLILVC